MLGALRILFSSYLEFLDPETYTLTQKSTLYVINESKYADICIFMLKMAAILKNGHVRG